MHSCSTLVISCIDFRIQPFVEDWAREKFGVKDYDRVAWAGGVLHVDEIMGQIDLSVKLHHINTVVLMNHEDCGAYGKTGLPAKKRAMSRERIVREAGEWQAMAGTLEKHKEDLNSAAAKIHKKYPELTIGTYYVKLDGEVVPA